jgi:hypothetical protein
LDGAIVCIAVAAGLMLRNRSRTMPRQMLSEENYSRAQPSRAKALPYVIGAGAAVALFAISAVINAKLAKKAERANPPHGHFVDVDGICVHYVERGEGERRLCFCTATEAAFRILNAAG